MAVQVELRVLELMASKICHDLISPVGAIGNGLELMEDDDGSTAKEALQLSQNCVRRASALLELFRMSYGTAGSDTGLGWDAAKALAGNFLAGTKMTLKWPPLPSGTALPPGATKLLLNLVVLGCETLPRGGEIAVAAAPAGKGLGLKAVATGQDARVNEEVASTLAGKTAVPSLNAKTVHGYFSQRLAESLGARIEVAAAGAGSVTLAAQLPG
ncbi:MAG TPA: histidine phosphotransferase family protein [Dongiaceae bacterium]|jgi:histidine phosphotransferase ChpT